MTAPNKRVAVVTCALVVAMVCALGGASVALADPANNNVSTATTQTLPIVGLTGSLDSTTTDTRDVYKIWLAKGKTLDASMTVTNPAPGTNFDIFLYRPGTPSIDETATFPIMMWGNGPLHEHFTFMAYKSGWYYLDVSAWKGAGDYTLDARIRSTVSFSIGSFSMQTSARRYKKVPVSAVVTPAYNGYNSPVFFDFYRYERGKYRYKTTKVGGGIRNPGEARSKLTASYKFPKTGKWRARAVFWDEAHPAGKWTRWKYIRVR